MLNVIEKIVLLLIINEMDRLSDWIRKPLFSYRYKQMLCHFTTSSGLIFTPYLTSLSPLQISNYSKCFCSLLKTRSAM
jgi:hypothetical protein